MSTRRAPRPSSSKRVPYKPPRDRRELYVAIGVAVLIVVVTATLVWFLRPNRDSGGATETPSITSPTTLPTDTTAAPTDSTTPPTDSTAAPTDSTQAPAETTTSSP
jgi:hypothetical protein